MFGFTLKHIQSAFALVHFHLRQNPADILHSAESVCSPWPQEAVSANTCETSKLQAGSSLVE